MFGIFIYPPTKPNTVGKKTLKVLLVIDIVSLLILSSFYFNAFDFAFYKKEFKKYNVYEKYKDADEINKDVLDYLQGKEQNINSSIFDAKEKSHLNDVKMVFTFLLWLFYICVVLLPILAYSFYRKYKKGIEKESAKVLIWGGAITLVLVLIIIILSKTNYDSLFTFIHSILFVKGTWVFDNTTIVNIYQYEFFYDMFGRILSSIVVSSAVLIGSGLILRRFSRM